jgi:hypothetical protein
LWTLAGCTPLVAAETCKNVVNFQLWEIKPWCYYKYKGLAWLIYLVVHVPKNGQSVLLPGGVFLISGNDGFPILGICQLFEQDLSGKSR